ncbi:MAG: hypothetical protein AB7T49_17670 [Oligoflexales bacterium]
MKITNVFLAGVALTSTLSRADESGYWQCEGTFATYYTGPECEYGFSGEGPSKYAASYRAESYVQEADGNVCRIDCYHRETPPNPTSESKLRAAAINVFENSEAVADLEYSAHRIPRARARNVLSSCDFGRPEDGRCFALVQVEEDLIGAERKLMATVAGAYLVKTRASGITAALEISVTRVPMQLYGPPEPKEVFLRSVRVEAEGIFSTSAAVLAWEKKIKTESQNEIHSIGRPDMKILHSNCTDLESCVFVVSGSERLYTRNVSEVGSIDALYLMETKDKEITKVEEIYVVGQSYGFPD